MRAGTVLRTFDDVYAVVRQIGQGGSGSVFEVRSAEGDHFALKLVQVGGVEAKRAKRFKNEVAFCRTAKHRNVIAVRDSGATEDGERLFYVMPLYPKTLRDAMNGKLPADDRLFLFAQVLDGVEAAHLQNVWHRDLKPENILYEPEGRHVVVADFGIAHFTEDLLHTLVATQDDERLANFRYAAPEQRVGGTVDHRADIFALGLLLHELFTGELAVGVGRQKIGDLPYLDDIVDKMIRQRPEDRYQSIAEVKGELIVRGNDFVTQQKLSALSRTVIPAAEVDDPLVSDPIRAVGVDYRPGRIVVTLNRMVTPEWESAFRNPSSGCYTDMFNPRTDVQFESNLAVFPDQGQHVAQAHVNMLKDWLSGANREYRQQKEREARQREREARAALEQQIREEKRAREVRASLKV